MIILLAASPDDLAKLEASLTSERFAELLSAARYYQKVAVYLPRFEMTCDYSNLKAELSALEMRKAFTRAAEFQGMTREESLYIDAVVHRAFVSVNEVGTEAAAATGGMVRAKDDPREPQVFRADRPVIFAIRDVRSGSVLFAGRLSRP